VSITTQEKEVRRASALYKRLRYSNREVKYLHTVIKEAVYSKSTFEVAGKVLY